MQEGDVLDGFAVSAHLGVDLSPAAEDRHRLQRALAVDPVCPEPAIGLEEGESDIGDGRDPGLDELVVDGE